MAAELPRPGVEVIQEFRTVSPSVVTPTLIPCIVGACRQIVEVLEGASLNADSKLSLPVFFTATNAALVSGRYAYAGLNGKKLYLSVDNSPEVEIEFVSDSMTPAAVVLAINTALNEAGVFSALAETKVEYEIDGTLIERSWTLRTVSPGELEKVEVGTSTDSAVWAKFGLKPGWVFTGLDMYDGSWVDVPWAAFPNPRNNLEELSVDPDSIRVFFASNAQNMRELQRKQGFCRRGGTINAYDDGNGDALTPFVDAPTENFTSTATAAYAVGTVDLDPLPGTIVAGLTLTLKSNRPAQTLTLVDDAPYALGSYTDLLNQLNDFFDDFTFALNGAGQLVITAKDKGQDSYLEVVDGTAAPLLGLNASVIGGADIRAAVAATGTLSALPGTILAGHTVVIGGKTYTFTDPVGSLDGDVFLGAGDAAALVNLKAAINLETPIGGKYATAMTLHPTVEATASDATTLSARAKTKGAAGNSIATTTTGGTTAWGNATLTGGQYVVSYPEDIQTKTIILDGTTYAFAGGAPADPAAMLVTLNAQFTDITFTLDGNYLKLVKDTAGSIVVGAGTVNTVLGLTANTYTASVTAGAAYPVQSGDELFIEGKSYGAINQVATGGTTSRLRLTKQVAMTVKAYAQGTANLAGLTFSTLNAKVVKLDGTSCTLGSFATTDLATNEALLISFLAAVFTGFTFTITAVGAAHYLKITKISSGPFEVQTALSDSANTLLGLTAAAYPPVLGANFYVVAKNLTGDAARPTPELAISDGIPVLMHDLLRETSGAPSSSAKSYAYMMYKALRRDVSPAATKPGLLKFDNTTDVANELAPISVENPLALGLYLALLNCPGAQVTGLGVDDVAADMPEGTVEAFTRAAEFLEGVEVYAVAPLSHDKTVGEVYNVHVSTMSLPENKGERVCLFNSLTPTHELDTLVTSGATGNSLGAVTFDTGIANLSTLLVAAGVPNPVGVIDAKYGVYVDVATDSKKYSVESVSGSIVTIRLTFTNGANDDGFYAESPDQFPPNGVPLIDETFAVKIRGAALTLPTGKPDKAGIALTLQQYAQTFSNRRFWHLFPDKCAATIGGVEQLLEGYYMCAGYAGLIAGQPPQQSFTNFPLTGYTRVLGSNDTYSEKQLNVMAAGGNWIVVQDTQNSPLVARMALTTDMTSVETRTDSITKVVDFTAKIMRRGFRNFIGRFNVTQGFIDSLGHVGQGILIFLTESGVLIGGSLNNIIQDENSPDTVLIDCTLDPPYPCNYIRLTLVI
jgi:hypothetical protein